MDIAGTGTLKCVLATSSSRDLAPVIEMALRPHIRAEDLRRLGAADVVVFGEPSPAQLRDWLAPALREGESVLVVEFERWSSFGPATDTRWLSRRGH